MQLIVIIGATSAMAEHCARLWAQAAPVRLTLVGRDEARTSRVADDLRVRSPLSTVQVMTTDFVDGSTIQQTVHTIVTQAPVDVVLIAHGMLSAAYVVRYEQTLNDLAVLQM
jgi:NADP-dependent 3-hydroxy acid dehydrogenase YdfG